MAQAAPFPGFHLLDAITSAAALFHRFGGHAHAVGFSLPTAALPQLRDTLRLHAATHLHAGLLVPELLIDTEISPAEITKELFQWLERLAPFGHGNPEPVLLSRALTLAAPPRFIQQTHICLPILGGLSAMGWSRPGQTSWPERIAPFRLTSGSQVDCVFHLRENRHPRYGGIELDLIDLAPTGP